MPHETLTFKCDLKLSEVYRPILNMSSATPSQTLPENRQRILLLPLTLILINRERAKLNLRAVKRDSIHISNNLN